MNNKTMYIVLLLINFLYTHEFVTHQWLTTIKELGHEGFTIEQINPIHKTLLAIKSRHKTYDLKIVTYDNKTLFNQKFTDSIYLLSSGYDGFSWKEIRESPTVHCYRLSLNMEYQWDCENGYLIDCIVNKQGDCVYYQYTKTEDNNMYLKHAVAYQKNELPSPVLNKSTCNNSSVLFLDSFAKYQLEDKSSNFLLIDKKLGSSALIIENKYAYAFGNYLKKNTIAVNNAHTQICLRQENLFHFYTPQTKDMVTTQITSPINAKNEREAIQYFLFSPFDKYVVIFFDTFLQVYTLENNTSFQTKLPKPFKAAYIFLPEKKLVMQSIFDTFFKITFKPLFTITPLT